MCKRCRCRQHGGAVAFTSTNAPQEEEKERMKRKKKERKKGSVEVQGSSSKKHSVCFFAEVQCDHRLTTGGQEEGTGQVVGGVMWEPCYISLEKAIADSSTARTTTLFFFLYALQVTKM